ncbi:hypothetical protein CANCADRAFT_2727 [Tortispora caseinolytica NRRL Y-17796]|uniref:Uncharacterized protein n=1 Tax=Tortispora caseinolytica NRRL Y-17796 TaxID=767744 RepID=A0A1E4TH24_9ASCO|nr:hypothetical protein CANCADRAFT_2727 [Tortispora caseinolytica NRRL Y-17796]
MTDIDSILNENSDDFNLWEEAIKQVESKISKSSSSSEIKQFHTVFDQFLTKFPLLYGYWMKYANIEFKIKDSSSSELIYERAVASIPTSVDLWVKYIDFETSISQDHSTLRSLYKRATASCGRDFMSHTLWDKYIEFETSLGNTDEVYNILDFVIRLPLHQYARYFEQFSALLPTRPLHYLVNEELTDQFAQEIDNGAQNPDYENLFRSKVTDYYKAIALRTQNGTSARWSFESKISRPYFHIAELEYSEIRNWSSYLDFEEDQGDFDSITALYERCLVPCALYDSFWLRYIRWLSGKLDTEEEVRNIYKRACSVFVPIGRPFIRISFALFEEANNRPSVANDIYNALLYALPDSLEVIISKANFMRRTNKIEDVIDYYKSIIDSPDTAYTVKGPLTVELAKLYWKIQGDPAKARELFQQTATWYLDSPYFWINYLKFEIEQPLDIENPQNNHKLIAGVHYDIITNATLPPHISKDLSHVYMDYLLQHGDSKSLKEYMYLDRQINGPFSVQDLHKRKLDTSIGSTEPVKRQKI